VKSSQNKFREASSPERVPEASSPKRVPRSEFPEASSLKRVPRSEFLEASSQNDASKMSVRVLLAKDGNDNWYLQLFYFRYLLTSYPSIKAQSTVQRGGNNLKV
jgi:hypothetical protein